MNRLSWLRPRWRKVLIDLWENKARTLLVVVSIAIGVFAIGMIAGAYLYLSQDLNISYTSTNPANIQITTDPFEDEFTQSIERIESVKNAEGRRVVTVRVQTPDGEWKNLDLIAVSDFSKIAINRLTPEEGAGTLSNRQVILVDNKKLDRSGLQTGQNLQIMLSDDTAREIAFVGTVQDPAAGYDNLLGNIQGYIQIDSLEWLHEPENFNLLYVTAAENVLDKSHIQEVANQVTDKIEKTGRTVYHTKQAMSEHPLSAIVNALLGILFILGILIVFLSGSLISNTLSALIGQQMRQIGVMKLVGARQKQVIEMYMMLILIFGLIAVVIAVPLGSQAAYALANYAANLIVFDLQGYRVMPLVVLIQVVIGLLVPLIAGLLPVLKGSRITVVKAISSTGIEAKSAQKHGFDRLLDQIKGVSRPFMISIRNTFRRKGRLALTLFTLTLGGAIFISVFNVQDALNAKITQANQYFKADVNMDFERNYRLQEVQQLAVHVPGVENVEGWAVAGAEILDVNDVVVDNLTVMGIPVESSLVQPRMLEGRWLEKGERNAIAVNEAFWNEFPDLKIGDNLSLKVNGKDDTWQVVGIFQYTGMDSLFAYADYDFLARTLNTPGMASVFRVVTSDHSAAFQMQASSNLDTLFRDHGFRVSKVEAGSVTTNTTKDYIGILTAVLLIMAILTALVGSIGLAGTLSMNVMERTREIGVMRAIGAYDRIVIKLVVGEGFTISLISFILGLVFSLPITYVLSNVISMAIFNGPADFMVNFVGILIWLVLVALLSVVASLAPARSASQMTIREVLSYE